MNKANQPITRGEKAQLLASLHFNNPMIGLEEAVQFMYDANISNGYDASNKTFENYGVNNKLMRSHISTFFKNMVRFYKMKLQAKNKQYVKNHFVLTPKWFFHRFHGELDCRFLFSSMLNLKVRKAMKRVEFIWEEWNISSNRED